MDNLQKAVDGGGRKEYTGARVGVEVKEVCRAEIAKAPAGRKKIGGVVIVTIMTGRHRPVRAAPVVFLVMTDADIRLVLGWT